MFADVVRGRHCRVEIGPTVGPGRPFDPVGEFFVSQNEHLVPPAPPARHPESAIGAEQPPPLDPGAVFDRRGSLEDDLPAGEVVIEAVEEQVERVPLRRGPLLFPLVDLVGVAHPAVFVGKARRAAGPGDIAARRLKLDQIPLLQVLALREQVRERPAA